MYGNCVVFRFNCSYFLFVPIDEWIPVGIYYLVQKYVNFYQQNCDGMTKTTIFTPTQCYLIFQMIAINSQQRLQQKI